MPVREALHRVARSLVLFLSLSLSLLPSPLAAKTRPTPALEPGYVAADHFLQAWQSDDVENGIVLLSSPAKKTATTDAVEKFFSNLGPSAYEIGRGRLRKRGRYEFPVVLIGNSTNHARRRFCSIVIVDTGKNEWAVDKLP